MDPTTQASLALLLDRVNRLDANLTALSARIERLEARLDAELAAVPGRQEA